jgi:D-alanyl-D-alanine carboxypeptidase
MVAELCCQLVPAYHAAMDRALLERSLAYVDSWLSWRCARADIPGCAVAVSLNGRVLLSGAYGKRDLAKPTKLKPDDVFRIASHSKSFAATAVMQLVEKGKLRLDDPVATHLGFLSQHRDKRLKRVTLRQLLCHGAGIIRDGTDADYWQLLGSFPGRDELRQWVLDADLVTEANVALKYSNIGYGLVGLVIEEVTGESFQEYAASHITGPLGLSSTVAEPERSARRAVTGYSRRGPDGTRKAIPHVDTRALAAATGFASTAPDLCKYFTAHFVGSNKLLSDESKREMQRVHWRVHRPAAADQDYGLGLMLERIGNRTFIGHGGGFPGQITHTLAEPGSGLVVTALTSCIDGPAVEIVRGTITVIDHFQAAKAETSSRQLRALEGRYANLWSVCDLVVAGEKPAVAWPDTWSPLANPDRLEAAGPRALKITDTSSYGSAGELLTFEMEKGRVKEVRWAGESMWPETDWQRRQTSLLRAAGQRR